MFLARTLILVPGFGTGEISILLLAFLADYTPQGPAVKGGRNGGLADGCPRFSRRLAQNVVLRFASTKVSSEFPWPQCPRWQMLAHLRADPPGGC